jgi:hypothetical protein
MNRNNIKLIAARGRTKMTPLIILITIVFLSSCDILSELTKFDLPYETSVSVPLIVASDSTLSIETPSINTGISAAMDKYNTGLDMIDEITLTSMTLTLTEPVDGDFGFLKSIAVFISATGQEEIQLAFDTAVTPDAGAVLELETSDADLQNYIKMDDFKMRFSIGTDETVLTRQEITMNMLIHVDAKVLGL